MILLDVRSPEEFNQGHFKEAINFPVEKLGRGELPPVAKEAEIAVYCFSGGRSEIATQILKRAGFTSVKNMGGIKQVYQAGFEFVK